MSYRNERYHNSDKVLESRTYKWNTVLPYYNDCYMISSPKFSLLDADVSYCVTMDIMRRYSVQLCGAWLNKLSCAFSFYVTYRLGGEVKPLFNISGHLYTSDVTFALLTFDERELKEFPFYKRHRPVSFTFTVTGCGKDVITKVEKCVQTASYMNTGYKSGSLADDFQKLLRSSQDADVKVSCGGEVIKAHSFIFNTRSEVLKATLRNDGKVHLVDMDASSFWEFMQFLYTDSMPELDYDKAKTLYEIGDMYALTSLMRRCGEFLIDNLNRWNVCECLGLAEAHSDAYVKSRAAAFILAHEIYLDDEIWIPFCDELPGVAVEILNKSYRSSPKRRKNGI